MSMNLEEEKGSSEDYTKDGTVDLKGRPVLRSNTGRWRACSFFVGYEVFERMAYYGIATNLVLYLSDKFHEGTVKASNDVTNWIGTVWLTPILGAYVADAYLGRYWTFIFASSIYFLGMVLLTLAVSIPALKPPTCAGLSDEDCDKQASSLQIGVFYCALYIIAIGTGGTKPNISTMGADQFDDHQKKEKMQKLSFFNWWMFSVFFGTLISNIFIVYIQDNVSWSVGYGVPTLGLGVSILVFVIGTPYYRHKAASGSPMTKMAQVVVASFRKLNVVVPDDPKDLYELNFEEYSAAGKYRINHTSSLRLDLWKDVVSYVILDRAAVQIGKQNSWRLCPVTQVEETKQMIKMIPILISMFIPSTMLAQTHTLFIKQGKLLERSIGPDFNIPPASLSAFTTIFFLITIVLYDRFFVPLLRRYTKNPRGITMLQRMGLGLCMHIITMVVASLVETKRLNVAKQNHILGKTQVVPLSIFILLPQFALMGIADSFVEVAKLEFFYDQAPEGMKSLGTAYFTTSLGVGYFLSSFLLSTVAHVTKKNGHKGWILNNLNLSHLDYYYALYAVLSFLNLIFFLVIAKFFIYNIDDEESERRLQEKSVDS